MTGRKNEVVKGPASSKTIAILLGRFGSGGVERVSCLIANGLAEQGWHVRFWVSNDTGPARSLLNEGVRISSFLFGTWGGRKLRLLLSIPQIAWQIRRTRPAVFLSPGNHTHLAAGLAHALARCRDVRLVVKLTNPVLKTWHQGARRGMKSHYYRWLYRRADQILVLSQESCPEVRAQAGRPVPVKFVHNPYIQARAAVAAPSAENMPVILGVGRLSRQKNFGLLLEALAEIQHREWRLVLLGEGPEKDALQDRAVALGIADRVEFAGYVVDPSPHYDRAHFLVLSSLWEDLPAVALEAMGVGCPVVATDCSAALTTLIAATGFGRVVPVEAGPLAQAMAQMLDRPLDRTVPPAVLAYSVANGVNEHAEAMAALL
ncbi:glycosyltransferase [Sphingobium estronivorans]|uniref:glycosyltransferase n=1 Tax=Sphingobium estronivorans TaxID=1577690 RepID=UPI0013C2F75E|nr:glycosyltransferase [Sphingobium estronivorans]